MDSPRGTTPEPSDCFASGTKPSNALHIWLSVLTIAVAVVILVGSGPVLARVRAEETEPCAADVENKQAESIRLAGEAPPLLDVGDVELAMLLGICALQTAFTPEADAALQQAMIRAGALRTFAGGGGIFSPDGRTIFTHDGNVGRLWDAETGAEVQAFIGHTDNLVSMYPNSFSPDGRYLLTTSLDKTARMWDVETGEERLRFVGHTDEVSLAVFSSDGKYVLTAASAGLGLTDNTARLWDAQTGAEVMRFVGHIRSVFGAAISPDGRYVATSSWDTTVRLWDAATGQQIRLMTRHANWAGMVAFSSDSRYLLSSGAGGIVRLQEVQTGNVIRDYKPQGTLSRSLIFPSFSPDGRYVLASDRDHALALLWDAETGERLRVFDVDADRMYEAWFSPDGKSVITTTSDGLVRVWETEYQDFAAAACQRISGDFTTEERQHYGLGKGPACP